MSKPLCTLRVNLESPFMHLKGEFLLQLGYLTQKKKYISFHDNVLGPHQYVDDKIN